MLTNPEKFRDVIDIAVEGVKAYAEKQQDTSSALAARLITILELNKISNTGNFTPKEVLEVLEPNYGGTLGLKALHKKLRRSALLRRSNGTG
jgi:hypothetical protein